MDISWRGAMSVWHRDFMHYRRSWAINLLPNFFEPVVYLAAMGIGLGAYIGQQMEGMTYLAFLAPGLVVSNAMNGASFETTWNLYVRLHHDRTYDAIIATPVSIEDAMLGEILWAVSRGTIYGVIFALVLVGFGLLGISHFVLLIPIIVLTAWLFAATGLVFTAYVKVIDLYSFYYTLYLTPMFLFSGIFFPLETLPDWVSQVAWATPLYHVVRLSKAVVHGGWDAGHALNLGWAIVVSIGFTIWGMLRIRKTVIR